MWNFRPYWDGELARGEHSPSPAGYSCWCQGYPEHQGAGERSYPISPGPTSHQGAPGPQVLPKARVEGCKEAGGSPINPP